jgi:hypothetical protein
MVNNRDQLKEYALRALGAPLITIDVTEEQMDDRIDQAISFFNEYYWDGITKELFKHKVTAEDITNKYIAIPDHIWSVTRVFSTSNSTSGQPNIFDLEYQLRMNDLRDLTSTSMIYYTQVMSHIALLDYMLNTQRQFRFNRLSGKLFLDLNWEAKIREGEYILVEAYAALDPTESPKMWNERMFKEYVIALFKSQWGTNIKKYSNISLPGGVMLDGQALYQEANDEMREIEDYIKNNSAPLDMFLG